MRALIVVLSFFAAITFCRAQSPAAPTPSPAFEVASVKTNNSGARFQMFPRLEGEHVTATNTPLRSLIQVAYNVGSDLLVGGPSSIYTERFDITAKVGGPLTGNSWQLMLRSLLAERFKLIVHTETRERPIFA